MRLLFQIIEKLPDVAFADVAIQTADSPAYRIFVAWFSSYGFIEQFLNVRKGYRHFENTK